MRKTLSARLGGATSVKMGEELRSLMKCSFRAMDCEWMGAKWAERNEIK